MATQNQEIRNEWVEVKASLSLADDQKYTFNNTGSFTLRLVEASSEPDADFMGTKLVSDGLISVTPAAGVNVYASLVSGSPVTGKSVLTVVEGV